jgi:O-antigen/teichoic acid export membrane protein
LANEGETATRKHLNHCLELLLAITLPCCIGYALLAGRIGNVVLGPEFRPAAQFIMPVVAIAVIIQIIVTPYFHISFFLANKNKYYIANTLTTLVLGTAISFVLIKWLGLYGAAWGRMASEAVGLISAGILARQAFPMPFPLSKIARVLASAIVMAVAVASLNPLFETWDKTALAVLIPVGASVYAATCWLLDVAEMRDKLAHIVLRLNSRTQP